MSAPDPSNELQQLRSQVAALEQLLEVYESTVAKQSDRFEQERFNAEQRTEALRESEERFKTLVDHAPEAIVLLDIDEGHFVDANENALQLFGLSHGQLIKLHPADVSPERQPDGRLSIEAAGEMISAALGGEKKVFDWMHRNSAGEDIPCEVRLVRLPGQENLMRASITDISARKQTELSLSRARDAAEAASRAKSDFLANMSHEIRTPLNSVIGMTELVLDSELTAAQREYLEMVKESGETLLAIINDMLDFSKIEAGKLELFPVAFDLRSRLHRIIKPLVKRAANKSVELDVQIAKDVSDSLTGDFERLRQVIVNLVGNAIKFTDQGQILLEVGLVSRTDSETMLCFTVTDSGIGIPQDKLARVFDAFEQADNSMTRRHAGTGLGLAISSRLVELLGGRLEVESTLGEGSKFHFTASFQLRPESAAEQQVNIPASEVASPVEQPLKILLAEDSEMNVKLSVALLSRWGHQVTVARDGDEAIALFKQQDFDLVLMDVQMPGTDGLKATTAIREMESQSGYHVPIIALTAHALPEDQQRCLAAGMDAYVTKPISPSVLRETIMSLVV